MTAPDFRGASTVAEAMLRAPKVLDASATVGEVRALFADDHVHAALVVARGTLLSVVERPDLDGLPDALPASEAGRLTGRVAAPEADLHATWRGMSRRRLAVVDESGRLLGLLCLKRSGRGFCSDADVAARAQDRASGCWGGPSRPAPASVSASPL
ncbi:CBS domain-containing protein [Amycolatopsis sp. AA4]|uniref:CBS domain-containing protein n=1 Tax=Actinomycetes TaxID=1760 RepID=UPI0001B585DC|nr:MULTISPECIES: CBS domain-containing protein [Actinomycetes]ATY11913.1 CBS domain-containing protein [Amycolatopsis sp. AA4]